MTDTPRRVTWLQLLTIAVVTAAAFAPVLHTPYAPLDDFHMLINNRDVSQPSWKGLVSFWTDPSFHIYMPLPLTVWQAVAGFTRSGTWGTTDFALPATGFKVVSVVTHALAAAAAAWTVSTLTRTRWPAVVGALVFALHPVQVEPVAWTTGLKDEMCGLFAILAIGLYARHADRDPPSPWADGWWWAAMAAAVLAMCSKPTAVVLPATLAAVDWAVRRCDLGRRVLSVGPFAVPAIAFGLVIVAVQGGSPVAPVKAWLRPLVVGDTYAFYLRKVVWPGTLAVDYGRRPAVVLGNAAVWWTWLVPAAAAVAVLSTRSRRSLLAATLFVLPVVPVSGITTFDMQQYSTVTDHYLYQPMLGVGLAVALLVRHWPRAAGGAAVLAAGVLAVMTARTAARWQDLGAYYEMNLAANPHSWMARDLLTVYSIRQGDLFTARRLAEESLRYTPESGGALDNKSLIDLLEGRYREAAKTAIEATQRSGDTQLPLARRITLLGARLKDPAIAEQGLRFWLKVEPDNRYAAETLRLVREVQAREAATRPSPATRP